MRSRQATLRVLVDTSFILPSLGIDVGREVLDGLKKLADVEAEIYYSRFSILESLWVVARLSKSPAFDADRFELGLRSVLESGRYKRVEESTETFSEALKLHTLGHKDMIDNLLYASSTVLSLKLCTMDTELKGFIRDRELDDTLILPDEIASFR